MTDAFSDHVYQIVITVDVVASTIGVSCGGLAPQLVRHALEIADDYLAGVSDWVITAENAGTLLVPAIPPLEVDDD